MHDGSSHGTRRPCLDDYGHGGSDILVPELVLVSRVTAPYVTRLKQSKVARGTLSDSAERSRVRRCRGPVEATLSMLIVSCKFSSGQLSLLPSVGQKFVVVGGGERGVAAAQHRLGYWVKV